ncbi:hypothetical protein VPH1254_0072 [Vibrio phage 1254]|nr:hypothetical protein SIPHO018v1_90004 [Vibrio phage 11E33.1]QZI86757.1 hypothetical protein SIPHO019v1_350002 [Vibrio phage 82E32.1]QZI92535.1 hypothetical protein SIPHO017v1_p0002 [Vibrio phage 19E33.1]QZI92792.1 hypothetical protein SIPHO016v1_p0013 [Vibrio phage 38E33.6a]QZI92980.1 hypothetical protein SIPHO015v1_p0042 [Vibrio phage 82E32.2]QZI93001.1 hypothetical protein SIPHO014v1_p0002 [Vibrio phage 82E32.3]QZI93110.1 hypothetical protein SIPHO013v1_p0049 [Vibrio phage 82E33.2]
MLVIANPSYVVIELTNPAQLDKLSGYVALTDARLKLWEVGKAVAQSEGLTPTEYNECFYDWYDALTGCGVEPDSSKEFHELLDIAITEFNMW